MDPQQPSEQDLLKASTLVEALPYIRRFAGSYVVIACTSSTIGDADRLTALADDVVLLRCVGINALLVAPDDAATVAALARRGGRGVGLSGQDGKVLGKDSVDPSLLKVLFDRGYIPVVAAITHSREGVAEPCDPVDAAASIAAALRAAKLFILDAGLQVKENGKLLELVDLPLAEKLAEELRGRAPTAAVRHALAAAARALKGGVTNVHLADSAIEHAVLLEIFTDRGIGAMVTNERSIIGQPEKLRP